MRHSGDAHPPTSFRPDDLEPTAEDIRTRHALIGAAAVAIVAVPLAILSVVAMMAIPMPEGAGGSNAAAPSASQRRYVAPASGAPHPFLTVDQARRRR